MVAWGKRLLQRAAAKVAPIFCQSQHKHQLLKNQTGKVPFMPILKVKKLMLWEMEICKHFTLMIILELQSILKWNNSRFSRLLQLILWAFPLCFVSSVSETLKENKARRISKLIYRILCTQYVSNK